MSLSCLERLRRSTAQVRSPRNPLAADWVRWAHPSRHQWASAFLPARCPIFRSTCRRESSTQDPPASPSEHHDEPPRVYRRVAHRPRNPSGLDPRTAMACSHGNRPHSSSAEPERGQYRREMMESAVARKLPETWQLNCPAHRISRRSQPIQRAASQRLAS